MGRRAKPQCPNCSSKRTIPIIYGEPSEEGMKQAEQGKIILFGGCLTYPSYPNWHCKNCNHDWNGEPYLQPGLSPKKGNKN